MTFKNTNPDDFASGNKIDSYQFVILNFTFGSDAQEILDSNSNFKDMFEHYTDAPIRSCLYTDAPYRPDVFEDHEYKST